MVSRRRAKAIAGAMGSRAAHTQLPGSCACRDCTAVANPAQDTQVAADRLLERPWQDPPVQNV